MKTFTRMIGRYVLATAAVVLLVVGLLLGTVVYLGLHYGAATDSRVRIGTLAEALTPTADGLQLDPARTPADWLQGYAWAMALDDDGSVIWQHDLPQNLNKHYTASEIASFSRWYLDDWPVFCWTADYGLFVAAVPRGSVWKYNIYNNEQLMNAMAAGMLPALALLLGVAAGCCLLFSWRGARRLQAIAAGLATVADGGTIRLPTDGFAGELADTVNRTSEQLRRRNEIIARRDDARTSWIAGVSHDVRTPLALILGWAEQLEQDTALPAAARQKACGIRTQSEKLRALIEDLNLTSCNTARSRCAAGRPRPDRCCAGWPPSSVTARWRPAARWRWKLHPTPTRQFWTRTPRCWPAQWKTCCTMRPATTPAPCRCSFPRCAQEKH